MTEGAYVIWLLGAYGAALVAASATEPRGVGYVVFAAIALVPYGVAWIWRARSK